MWARRLLIAAALSALAFAQAIPTRAATVIYDSNGDVTGIVGLWVPDDPNVYVDIAFLPGTNVSYNTAYGGEIVLNEYADFIGDAIGDLLNSLPQIPDIAGTTAAERGGFLIPWWGIDGGAVHLLWDYHLTGDTTARYPGVSYFAAYLDASPPLPHYDWVWTSVTPSAVPLPAALPLFASGLGVMGVLAWRRKRKKAAAKTAA